MLANREIAIHCGINQSEFGQRKFSSVEKLESFIKSFGDGDYNTGFEYIRKMLTGGLE